jgi:RNA polymerase sigma-70 factor (ECF subfamily)
MDEAAFRLFYEATAARLRAYLRRVGGDAALADDVLQESFYRLWRSPPAGASDGERTSFLYRVATRVLYDHWRRARRERESRARLGSEGEVAPDRSGGIDVARALARLPPKQRALLWLAYVEGRDHEEIAGILELKAPSVKVLLFRARRAFASLLEERAAAPPGGEGA